MTIQHSRTSGDTKLAIVLASLGIVGLSAACGGNSREDPARQSATPDLQIAQINRELNSSIPIVPAGTKWLQIDLPNANSFSTIPVGYLSRVLILDKDPRFAELYKSDRAIYDSLSWQLAAQSPGQTVNLSWEPFTRESGLPKSSRDSIPVRAGIFSGASGADTTLDGVAITTLQNSLALNLGVQICGVRTLSEGGHLVFLSSTNPSLPSFSYSIFQIPKEFPPGSVEWCGALESTVRKAVQGLQSEL